MARRKSSRGAPGGALLIRHLHAYLSVLVAPTVLFFASTGFIQLFGWHEAHGDYHPPVVIEKLSNLHKDQFFGVKPHRAPESAAPSAPQRSEGDWVAPVHKPDEERTESKASLLKLIFGFASLSLVVSTSLGVWMALTQSRRKVVLAVLFAVGLAGPVAVLLLL